jgi:beta-mannosidase
VFLSQIQQGLAIKTAIEYWRSTKPRCMGTLYWQINDIYPVASWASLDYGGQWKLLHYMARRFFNPINVVAVPDGDTILLKAINDTAEKAPISVEVQAVDAAGKARVIATALAKTNPDKAVVATKISLSDLAPNEFLFFSWTAEDGRLLGENDYFPRAYKAYDIAEARVKASWSGSDKAPVLTLSADKPAMFVTATVDLPGYFSDNAVTLVPGRDVKLSFTPRKGATVSKAALQKSLKVSHLRETY